MKKNCIITVGIGHWYPKGVERLRNSLEGNFDGDFVSFTEDLPGCPKHSEIPYAFKPFAMNLMRERGYTNVMWMDASFWAIKPLTNIFDHIQEFGYFMVDAGHVAGVWTSDRVLEAVHITRDDAMKIPLFIAGGFGLAFDSIAGNVFLDTWLKCSRDGYSFHGKWDNNDQSVSSDPRCHGHRHDMSVGSLIAKEMGLKFLPNNTHMAYYEWYQQYKNDPAFDTENVALLLQGM